MVCDLRIGSCVASVELPVIRWRCNDLGNDTQIIAKEQRSKGRKHSNEELVNLGLHDELLQLDMQTVMDKK
jgi:hypothetical protein